RSSVGYSGSRAPRSNSALRWAAIPNLGTINAIALVAAGEGWAAADGGLLHLHDGTWTAVVNSYQLALGR
ncbi:MAG: hypothetical protein ACXVCX_21895, partial [Ktedonobacterales bacterium]